MNVLEALKIAKETPGILISWPKNYLWFPRIAIGYYSEDETWRVYQRKISSSEIERCFKIDINYLIGVGLSNNNSPVEWEIINESEL